MSNISNLTADGSTEWVLTETTGYQMEAVGTFGGGTVTVEKLAVDQTSAITLDDKTLTSEGAINIEAPRGVKIRATLSGATSPDIDIHFAQIK